MVGNAQAQGLESQDFAGHGQSSAGKGAECPAAAVASADRSAIGNCNAALPGSRMRNATHPRSHAAADPQLHTKHRLQTVNAMTFAQTETPKWTVDLPHQAAESLSGPSPFQGQEPVSQAKRPNRTLRSPEVAGFSADRWQLRRKRA